MSELAQKIIDGARDAFRKEAAVFDEKFKRLEENQARLEKENESLRTEIKNISVKDGVGVKSTLIDNDGALIITLTDGDVQKLGVIVGKDGINGKDAPVVDEKALYERVLANVVKSIPEPVNGKDGVDGKDADQKAIIKAVLKSLPKPVDGKNGTDGKDGADIDTDAVYERLSADIKSLIPEPVPGEDGKDGKSLEVADIEPVIEKMMAGAVKELAPTLKEHIQAEAKAAAKDMHPVSFRGKFDPEEKYINGNIIQHAGSVWIADDDNPGDVKDRKSAWRLLMKSPSRPAAPKFEPKPTGAVTI